MTAIRPGQIYEAVKPNPADPTGTHRRIRIVRRWSYGKVEVETVRADGSGIRQRALEVSELHATVVTKTGQPRRNGYVLVQTEEQP